MSERRGSRRHAQFSCNSSGLQLPELWMGIERSANFTPEECQRLTTLIDKYKETILCAETDGKSWASKENAWQNLEKEFNAKSEAADQETRFRTVRQLKNKFENMKKTWRKTTGEVTSNAVEDSILLLAPQVKNEPAPEQHSPEPQTLTQTYQPQPQKRKIFSNKKEPNRSHQLRKRKMRHVEELHKQELRHREEEHELRMRLMWAKAARDKEEHEIRMEKHRLKVELLKKQCLQSHSVEK